MLQRVREPEVVGQGRAGGSTAQKSCSECGFGSQSRTPPRGSNGVVYRWVQLFQAGPVRLVAEDQGPNQAGRAGRAQRVCRCASVPGRSRKIEDGQHANVLAALSGAPSVSTARLAVADQRIEAQRIETTSVGSVAGSGSSSSIRTILLRIRINILRFWTDVPLRLNSQLRPGRLPSSGTVERRF